MSAPVLGRRHLRFGWWALALFATGGIALEMLHGFKVGAYLDVTNETRRLMWRLAHAHGTLLGLVNLAFAASLANYPKMGSGPGARMASHGLLVGSVLLPMGFFLGGFGHQGGDPGLGVLLTPVGATVLVLSLIAIARRT